MNKLSYHNENSSLICQQILKWDNNKNCRKNRLSAKNDIITFFTHIIKIYISIHYVSDIYIYIYIYIYYTHINTHILYISLAHVFCVQCVIILY